MRTILLFWSWALASDEFEPNCWGNQPWSQALQDEVDRRIDGVHNTFTPETIFGAPYHEVCKGCGKTGAPMRNDILRPFPWFTLGGHTDLAILPVEEKFTEISILANWTDILDAFARVSSGCGRRSVSTSQGHHGDEAPTDETSGWVYPAGELVLKTEPRLKVNIAYQQMDVKPQPKPSFLHQLKEWDPARAQLYHDHTFTKKYDQSTHRLVCDDSFSRKNKQDIANCMQAWRNLLDESKVPLMDNTSVSSISECTIAVQHTDKYRPPDWGLSLGLRSMAFTSARMFFTACRVNRDIVRGGIVQEQGLKVWMHGSPYDPDEDVATDTFDFSIFRRENDLIKWRRLIAKEQYERKRKASEAADLSESPQTAESLEVLDATEQNQVKRPRLDEGHT